MYGVVAREIPLIIKDPVFSWLYLLSCLLPIALLSLDLSFEQNSHNRVRHHPPMAVGEIFFNASNLAVKGVSSGVDVFFGNVANKVVYDFYPDFGANATALNATQFTHNYTDVG